MLSPDENKPQGNIDWLSEYGLDLQDRVECDTKNCENEATHYAKAKCCGTVLFGCEGCLTKAYDIVKYMIRQRKPITCHACGSRNIPMGWLSAPEKISLL